METSYGKRLQAARKEAGYRTQEALGDQIGRSGRAVRNWETGANTPDDAIKAELRRLLGPFDSEGDPVEVAIKQSGLTEDRQHDVIGYYLKRVREQREGQAS